ncbi:alanine racemase [Limnospira fusiformis KN01]|uniref:Alanine racemase n=2 Tax=Limnospira TaxID=2596745 RepID=A0A9P1NWV0_9CYAN|nr:MULTISPECIES: alanine racemase [Limnospira]EKD10520.1 alanine racemase [Arthrospira platensis C1]MDC0840559.1 alanine racemase [Limnoraphis robusta]MDY7051491.1 alanine racemase [Limnospira fusiformis LS22]QJB28316.1 alanine racemase [Limnospira fusiformis SAG 85.79]EDZ97062.1 alanine racemase [Limnospira maxima CS-328]
MVSRKSEPLAQDDRTYTYEGECEHRAWVEVDRWAIANNVKQIRHLLSPETRLMAVIKADAYGHGAVSVAKIVSEIGVDDFAVATIPEGIELRRLGIQQPILVLGAVHTSDEIKAIAHWGLQPTLCTPTQALLFSETLQSIKRSLPVQLNIDTGMSRLGTWWEQALEFVQLVRGLPNLEISGIYSHFATADIRDRTIMDQQHWRFQQVLAQIQEHTTLFSIPTVKPCLHLANSAATLTDPALHYDMVRVGLSLYGLYPAPHLRSVVNLQPAMSIRARVTQIKTIEAGCGVSYGYKFIAKQKTPIAVVGIGYADGVPRHLSNQMKVLIRGQFVPQIGAITMDQLMLDVTAIPDLQVGEVVTLLGSDRHHSISADDWAEQLGTISWEILCGFKHRLPRILIN